MWADFKFKWKCYYKVCWARGQKAEHLALLMFWSLTLCYLCKEKSANICLIKNMFSPSTNGSSRVPLLSLFSEPGFRSDDGELGCKHEAVRFCQITWRVPGQVFSRDKVWHRWLSAAQGSALFSDSLQTMPCKLLPEMGNETGWFVCPSIANPAAPHRNVGSVCFFHFFSENTHCGGDDLLWTVLLWSSFAKEAPVRPTFLPI